MKMGLQKEFIRDGRAPIPEKEFVSKVMSANRGKNTKPELILRTELWKKNIRGYRLHPPNLPGKPDIVYRKKRLAIFINGCFWHRCPYCNLSLPKSNTVFWKEKFERNINRDEINIKKLTSQGWITITVWECQIRKDLMKVVDSIRRTIQGYNDINISTKFN